MARPDLKFLLAHPAHFVALGFGAGLAPFAAGTWGTLITFPFYWLLALFLPPMVIALAAIPFFLIGIPVCETTARNMGVKDPNAICWDEIVAFLPLVALTHDSAIMMLIAFLAFRFYDVIKLFPANIIDKRMGGGIGIMLDDLFAALYAWMVVQGVYLANERWRLFAT